MQYTGDRSLHNCFTVLTRRPPVQVLSALMPSDQSFYPVSVGDVTQIAAEFKRAIGTGKDAPKTVLPEFREKRAP